MSTFERVLGLLASLIAVGTFIWAIATTFFGADFAVSFEPQAAKLPTPDLSEAFGGLNSIFSGLLQVIQAIFSWASQNIVLKVFIALQKSTVLSIFLYIFMTLP